MRSHVIHCNERTITLLAISKREEKKIIFIFIYICKTKTKAFNFSTTRFVEMKLEQVAIAIKSNIHMKICAQQYIQCTNEAIAFCCYRRCLQLKRNKCINTQKNSNN